jgi:hypothetical protein
MMTIRKFVLSNVLFVVLFVVKVSAQYAVESIPENLKQNAHLVIREYQVELEMTSVNKGNEKIRKILTVLDKPGENLAGLIIQYDKDTRPNIKQVILYDKNGKKLKSIKQSEIVDSPSFSSFELFSDDRLKYYKPDLADFPYTVEYDYEFDMDNMISYGKWSPVYAYNISLEHASLIFSHPSEILTNKKELQIKGQQPVILKNKTVEKWELNDIQAVEEEPFDVNLSERVPSVYLMPEILKYDKYEGKADTWQTYGKWLFDLYKGKDEISETEKSKIASLLENVPDTLERIKSLYKYMQNNTRYVAVTMGIGGFMPFDAATVYSTGYGDCKALSNYMHSLLKTIGVRSYPALVAAGTTKTQIFRDFPNFQQFNHVILCVIYKTDTTWLECTNQQIPFGFLGDFTDGRDVLLITEKGGCFAHTVGYSAENNMRTCFSEFKITENGDAEGSFRTIYSGLQYDDLESFLNKSYEEKKKWLYSSSTLPSLQISDFSVDVTKATLPSVKLEESFKSKNYCSFSGKYMLLTLNRMIVQRPVPKMLRKRESDVLINKSFTDTDTILYHIPDLYRIESLPSGIILNSDFGSYSYSVSCDKNDIVYIRRFVIYEGWYNPGDYNKLNEFISMVAKADNVKVLLTKK